ncbi:MAG TPA: tetratricopeptide repeat protein [Rhizomicrobium sp.]|nr:tetratricopeptide repeat protein [Rhizomicrobium sp.]
MILNRFCWVLPAILLLAAAEAKPLPVSQKPGAHKLSAPELDGRSGPGGYGNPFLWTCLADLSRGLTAKAEEACGRAIAINPKDADTYELRGYAYLIEHRFEHAEADFRVVLKLRSESAEVLAGLGQSLNGLGQFDRAVAQFAKAAALAPKNAAYRNGLCWARAGTGKNLKQALADCNAALALAPGTPGPLNSRSLVELRLGRFGAAVTDYTASLKAMPQQASARFGRGLAHLGLGHVAAGSADILSARKTDNEIDGLFVLLGLLPRECGQGKPKCPPGFPPDSGGAEYRRLAVSMPGN